MPLDFTRAKALLVLMVGLIFLSACLPQDEEIVTITMLTGSVGREFDVLQEQVVQFEEKNSHIKVQLLSLPESTDDRHAAYVSFLERETSSVDILMMDIIWPPEFGEKGWTVPLNNYVAQHDIDMQEFLPAAVEGNTWNGQLVSMPWFIDVGILFYRQDLLDKYGYSPPTTWDELFLIAEAITAAEKQNNPTLVGFVYQGDEYEGLVTNYLEYLWGSGGAVLNAGGNQVVLNSPESVSALETLIKMQEIAPAGIHSFREEDALNYFSSGNAVFMRNWPYAWVILNEDDALMKEKVGMTSLPSNEQGRSGVGALGGWQLGINVYSQHPDEAFELIAFLASLEQQNYKAIHSGQIPTLLPSYADDSLVTSNPHIASLLENVSNARVRPVHPRYLAISTILQQQVHLALTNKQTAAEATANMALEIQNLLQTNRGESESSQEEGGNE